MWAGLCSGLGSPSLQWHMQQSGGTCQLECMLHAQSPTLPALQVQQCLVQMGRALLRHELVRAEAVAPAPRAEADERETSPEAVSLAAVAEGAAAGLYASLDDFVADVSAAAAGVVEAAGRRQARQQSRDPFKQPG